MGDSQIEAAASSMMGRVVAGKYRVEQVLGRGGMGVVFAATHVELGQRVALKILRPDTAANQAVASRFIREARAAVLLRSEHVRRIIDVGTFDNGSPFIVMEFLDGTDLGSVLKTQGPLPIELACDYVVQACEAVAEAHANGIVHRDLKPANLFLTRSANGDSIIKVLDFGVSKVVSPSARAPNGDPLTSTHAGSVMGSPAYMSPEQLRSTRDVDERSDIWSLGVLLFQLVSGELPFSAPSFAALCMKVALDPPPSLADTPAGDQPRLDAIIHRCLEKEPAARYPDVATLAVQVAALAPPPAQSIAGKIAQIPERGTAASLAPLPGAPRLLSSTIRRRALPVVLWTVALVAAAASATALYLVLRAEPPLQDRSVPAPVEIALGPPEAGARLVQATPPAETPAPAQPPARPEPAARRARPVPAQPAPPAPKKKPPDGDDPLGTSD